MSKDGPITFTLNIQTRENYSYQPTKGDSKNENLAKQLSNKSAHVNTQMCTIVWKEYFFFVDPCAKFASSTDSCSKCTQIDCAKKDQSKENKIVRFATIIITISIRDIETNGRSKKGEHILLNNFLHGTKLYTG